MANNAQYSLEWYRQRLGKITGSQVGLLMQNGRSGVFSETAKTYIYKLTAERSMNPKIVNNDALFEAYIDETNVSTKAMRWGIEQEPTARDIYAKKTKKHIIEVGLKIHKTIPNFASSPDGYVYDENTKQKGSIEIKCFEQGKFIRLCDTVKDNETLLKSEPIIFYQCMAHLMCNETDFCDLVLYNPFQKNPIKIIRVEKDENAFAEMEQRIVLANEMIESIL